MENINKVKIGGTLYSLSDKNLEEALRIESERAFSVENEIKESINKISAVRSNVVAVDTTEELDDVKTDNYVKYIPQTLTEEEKQQARLNIGAAEIGGNNGNSSNLDILEVEWDWETDTVEITSEFAEKFKTAKLIRLNYSGFSITKDEFFSLFLVDSGTNFTSMVTCMLMEDGEGYYALSFNFFENYSGGNRNVIEVGDVDEVSEFIDDTYFYKWEKVKQLDLDFNPNCRGELLFQFSSGEEPTTLILPSFIKWENNIIPEIEPNKTYQVSILFGLASIMSWEI